MWVTYPAGQGWRQLVTLFLRAGGSCTFDEGRGGCYIRLGAEGRTLSPSCLHCLCYGVPWLALWSVVHVCVTTHVAHVMVVAMLIVLRLCDV